LVTSRLLRAHRIQSPPPYIIAPHVVALHGYSSSSSCRARTHLGPAASQVPPRPPLPRYHRARPRCPSCESVLSRHTSPPSVHARTARVLGPHCAATHASGSALLASGRLPPLGVPLLRSHAYTSCTAHAIVLPNRVVQPLLLALRLHLFSTCAPHSGACHARAHLPVPSLLQRLRSSVHHQHCIVPPLALTRTAAPTRSASSRAHPGPLRACSLPEHLLLREPHTSAPHPRACLALVLHAPPARPGPAPLAPSRACACHALPLATARAAARPCSARPSRRRLLAPHSAPRRPPPARATARLRFPWPAA
jgi:hypothetical protein